MPNSYLLVSAVFWFVIYSVSVLSYLFFVSCSISLARSRRRRVRELFRKGFPWARYARIIQLQPELYILSAQFGRFLSVLVLGFTLFKFGGAVGEYLLQSFGLQKVVGTIFSILVLILIILIFAIFTLVLSQLSKALVSSYPNRSLCYLSWPLIAASIFSWPFVYCLNAIVTAILRFSGMESQLESELTVSQEDLSEIIEMTTEAGAIEEGERKMIEGVFSFSDTMVREVMTPRKDIVSVNENSTLEEAARAFALNGFSRILVTGHNLDDVKGVLIAKDLMPFLWRGKEGFSLKAMLRDPYTVTNTKKTDELFKEFKARAVHFAVVVDEHGGVDGVVTIEDLVEEIVGEIFDEFDTPHTNVGDSRLDDIILDGSALIDDVNREFNLNLPNGEYDTVAGFVIHKLGRIPHSGELIEHEGLMLRVVEVAQNRLISLRMEKG